MAGHSPTDSSVADSKRAAKAQASVLRTEAKIAERRAAQARKDAKAASKSHRAEAKAARKVSKAARKASKAAAKASEAAAAEAATRPTRIFDRLTDPKMAKRAIGLGKMVAPALAPFALKAAVSARGMLDRRRAERLGVSPDAVAQFRGPTGPTGARIEGLTDALATLAQRKSGEIQVSRFVDVSRARLADLTAATQAASSMPRAKRARVLHAIGRELDGIDADLLNHLQVS